MAEPLIRLFARCFDWRSPPQPFIFTSSFEDAVMANFDMVVFGASSFVGQIITRYLWDGHGLNGEIRWAVAGRSAAQLAELKAGLGDALIARLQQHAGLTFSVVSAS